MDLKFLCEKCGKEIYPKQISYEEAENINNEAFFRKSDIYHTISPCDCLFEIEKDIIIAVKKTIQHIRDGIE